MAENAHIAALIKAQQEMGKLTKNSTNPHFKSKYADLTAVLETCTDALHSNGFAILQPSGKDEGGMFTDTILMHESGGAFATRVYWVGVKNDMQGSGSAMTYSRRYGLMSLTGLAPEDDDGAEAVKKSPAKREPEPQKPAPERNAGDIRDSLKKLIAAVKTADAYAELTSGDKFTGALEWLRDNDEPKHKEVVAAMNLAQKSVLDDSIPDFDKETGEVKQ